MFDTGKRMVLRTIASWPIAHTAIPEAGSTLGPETAQTGPLNGKTRSTNRRVGWFVEKNPQALRPRWSRRSHPRTARPSATARSTNEPGRTCTPIAGSVTGQWCVRDHRLRYDVMKDRSIRNRFLTREIPASSARSIWFLATRNVDHVARMNSVVNKIRMPEIASAIVDQAGSI
jgi:hypothetical protein